MGTNSSRPTSAKPISIRSGGKTGRCNVLAARATILAAGAHTSIALDAHATGAIAASAPSMTSRIPSCTRASGRWPTGYLPPSCFVLHARLGALPGNEVSISARAIAGAGGCAMPRCPMRWAANWLGRSKPMTSTTLPATRGKRKAVARSRWDAKHVAVGRNASPAEGVMTKTAQRSSPGSVDKGRSLSTRLKIAPSRRCKRPRTWPCKRAVGSTRTRPAVIGQYRATCMHSSITPRRNRRAVTCMSIAPRVCFPCSSRTYGCSVVSAHTTCPGMSDACSFCGTFGIRMRSSRAN
jgi:hypothetical protein